jgi:hypothetical protein
MDVIASGRDTSGGVDVVLGSGFLAGKHDGNNAVYDMKSLGKHIEAVRLLYSPRSVLPASGLRDSRKTESRVFIT